MLMKGGFFISFVCNRCGNRIMKFIGIKNNEQYCRKCIKFIGKEANKEYEIHGGDYHLNYNLTSNQQKASEFILNSIKNENDCAINAVCGAGKTEIIYACLKYCLDNHKKVGIAIPRKDVVIELYERIKTDFNCRVAIVHGGNTGELNGDIIIFTTHQAYRYNTYFDVLIIDEVDAFPYNSDESLQYMVKNSSKRFVYLSATMPDYIEKDNSILKFYLNRRYHNYDLPVPKCHVSLNMCFSLKKKLKKYKDKVVIVYFPTIKLQNKIAKKIKCDFLINSKKENRKELVKNIKKLKQGVVFSTTVLERGITVKDVQVIVYNSEHKLFTRDVLIQIAGRVGRNKDFYKGDIVFICNHINRQMKQAIKKIKRYNE